MQQGTQKFTKDELYFLVHKICSAFYVPGKVSFQPSVKSRDTEKQIVYSEVKNKLGKWASLKELRELSDKCVDECAICKMSSIPPPFRA